MFHKHLRTNCSNQVNQTQKKTIIKTASQYLLTYRQLRNAGVHRIRYLVCVHFKTKKLNGACWQAKLLHNS